jgi:hypothetical protein
MILRLSKLIMYQLDPTICFNEENGLNKIDILVNRWNDKYLPLRYLQFANSHYDSLEQQIQNTYEINTGVVLFATPVKIFCINLNADDILLTSIELDEERYIKTGKPHFKLTHFHDREINDGWGYRIVFPIFNLFWRQILRLVADSFNIQSTGLLKLLEDYPNDSDFDLIYPENCTESENKEQTTIIINSKVTQFPLFLRTQEEYETINLSLNPNTSEAAHYEYLNFMTDKALCAVNGLINSNRLVQKYKSEEFKAFSLSLDEYFKYWRQVSNMDIFSKHVFTKSQPFIPIRCSLKYYDDMINKNDFFNSLINQSSDVEEIERIAGDYGYGFDKVSAINLYSSHFIKLAVYHINGYYEQATQIIARDRFIEFKNSNLKRVSHLLERLNPLIEYFSKTYPNDENLRDFFQLKENLDHLYQIADARYEFVFQRDYDTKEIDVI